MIPLFCENSFGIFSQVEEQITVNDTINNLSTTNDVVDFFSISLSDDELNDDTSASDNISGFSGRTIPASPP